MQVARALIHAAAVVLLCAAAWLFPAAASPETWRAEGWQTDFSKTTIDFEEILSGGPPRDGIPSIDKPEFIDIQQEKSLGEMEPVIGLEIDGDARAYPLRVLIWHEIANDVVGGVPVAVTYCPLCNSAVVFERVLGGEILEFGVSGKLRNSDLVMYDRNSQSWWQQFTGEAIAGSYTGQELQTRPARLESFSSFKARNPNGRVLVPNNPTARDYGRNPYVQYDSAQAPFLYKGALPKGISPMARVVVVEVDGKPHAIPLEELRKKTKITIGDVELGWSAGQNSALDAAPIAQGRDVGNVTAQRKSDHGATDIRYDVTFAFVFHAFHPDRPIHGS